MNSRKLNSKQASKSKPVARPSEPKEGSLGTPAGATRLGYTPHHAASGLDHEFPAIECWPNQFPSYEIEIDIPEFTSVCPKTGLPDFGTIWIRYVPRDLCLELKSLKEYIHQYRNLGIFQENIVNRILEDVVRAANPVWCEVRGQFRPRGGLGTLVVARWPRTKQDAKWPRKK
jgi:7-cyano-7-deazaguanine reductase